jgi:hypothetical protein
MKQRSELQHGYGQKSAPKGRFLYCSSAKGYSQHLHSGVDIKSAGFSIARDAQFLRENVAVLAT